MNDESSLRSLADLDQQLESATAKAESVEGLLQACLQAVVELEIANAGVIWLVVEGQVRRAASVRLDAVMTTEKLVLDSDHQRMIFGTMQTGETRVLTGRFGARGLRPHSLTSAALRGDDSGIGVLELYAEPELTPDRHELLRSAADAVARHASRGLESSSSRADSEREFRTRLEGFTLALQQTLDATEVAAIAVNDGRQLLGLDRLSLIARRGSRVVVVGISGQDEVQRRANQVKAMAAIADQVMRTGRAFLYQGRAEDVPPPLEQLLSEYLVEGRSRRLQIVPLTARVSRRQEQDPLFGRQESSGRVIGCLVAEHLRDSRASPELNERLEVVANHVAAAWGNSQRYESIFLLPALERAGRAIGWFRGRNGRIAGGILGGIALAAGVLAFVPWDYRVEASGQAMPVIQHGVFAPRDAVVEAVRVTGNQHVTRGTELVLLRSPELEEQGAELRGEIGRLDDEVYKLLREQEEARRAGDRSREQEAYTGYRQSRTRLEAKREELRIVEEERTKLVVRSPADGVVATFQIEQLLRNRPVQQGELLLEVMDEAGDWRLELEVPEYRMGHLLQAIQAAGDRPIRVDYTPATDARRTLRAALNAADVATRSNQSEREGTIVEVFAAIDPDDLPGRRIGAAVDARIHCGTRSLFYCLFGDVVEFLQRKIWW